MTSTLPPQQSLTAKRAESQRPPFGEELFKEPGVRDYFWERAALLLSDVERLKSQQISFSPFLEIGAGSGQRSAALLNQVPSEGAASDIAQGRLAETPFVVSLLEFSRIPLLIACDAHSLPFLPNTFNFVFAYRTLHHFENPSPVIGECYRVLGNGGVLFFNEEPMDTPFRRLLRGKRIHASEPKLLERLGYRLGLENIFWDDGAYERSLGMTEARFELKIWREALQPFADVQIEVNNKIRIRSNLYHPRLNVLLSNFTGGNARGVCRKAEGQPAGPDFCDRLMCLDCHSNQLVRIHDELRCMDCQRQYPVEKGVIRMLPKELETELVQT